MPKFNLLFGSDHRGFKLKTRLMNFARGNFVMMPPKDGTIVDFGTYRDDIKCDALDHAVQLCNAFQLTVSEFTTFGILVCGSGQAMCMTANRFDGIRAALCNDQVIARMARLHNDANVLVLGADFIHEDMAEACLREFLTTPFIPTYSERRDKLSKLGGM